MLSQIWQDEDVSVCVCVVQDLWILLTRSQPFPARATAIEFFFERDGMKAWVLLLVSAASGVGRHGCVVGIGGVWQFERRGQGLHG